MGAWDGPEDKRAVIFSANPKTTAGSKAILRENNKHNAIGTAYSSKLNKPVTREAATERHENNVAEDKRQAEWKRKREQEEHRQKYQEKLKRKLKERKEQAEEKANEEKARHKVVDGKNIEHTFQRDKSNGSEIEDVLHQQGFDGLPKVVSSADFAKACQESGIFAARGIGAKDATTLAKYENDLKTGKFYVNCGGGSLYGHGMYMASAAYKTKPTRDESSKFHSVTDTANAYGSGYGKTLVINMTLDKSAKIVDYNDLIRQIRNDKSVTSRVDEGVYAAKKGYDAINVNRGSYSADYTVVLNRTKLIISA